MNVQAGSLMPCTNCNSPLPWEICKSEQENKCPACGTQIIVSVFPALAQSYKEQQYADSFIINNEASCFYHADKKATVICEFCGRFLCGLCDINFVDQHICSSCMESGKKNGELKNINVHCILYDEIAIATAVFPLIFIWSTILTAPVAIFMSIRYWNTPSSIIPRTKIRFILAILIAGFQIAGWLILFMYLALTLHE